MCVTNAKWNHYIKPLAILLRQFIYMRCTISAIARHFKHSIGFQHHLPQSVYFYCADKERPVAIKTPMLGRQSTLFIVWNMRFILCHGWVHYEIFVIQWQAKLQIFTVKLLVYVANALKITSVRCSKRDDDDDGNDDDNDDDEMHPTP